jgi:Carotenoid biosynthesis protein
MPEHAVSVKQPMKFAEGRHIPQLEIAAWIAFAVYLILVIGFAWNPTPLAQGLAAIGIAGACTHAVLFYGWKDAAVLMAICLVTTFTMENVGVATGMPFGHYHFEVGSDLMHVGVVPMIVGPLVRHGIFLMDRNRDFVRPRGPAFERDIRNLGAACGRSIRDGAMGCGDGPARGDHFQGLDMA